MHAPLTMLVCLHGKGDGRCGGVEIGRGGGGARARAEVQAVSVANANTRKLLQLITQMQQPLTTARTTKKACWGGMGGGGGVWQAGSVAHEHSRTDYSSRLQVQQSQLQGLQSIHCIHAW